MHLAKRWHALAWASFFYVLGTTWAAAATVSGVAPPVPGTYGPGSYTRVAVDFPYNEPVTVTGSPTLSVTIGGATREFAYDTAYSSSTRVSFLYQTQPGDNGTLDITGPINLNGGSIKDANGNDASLTFAPVDEPSVIYDTTAPAAPVLNSVSPGAPTSEQSFTISGTAEPNSTVVFESPSAGQGAVDANGNWSVTFGPMPAGSYSYTAIDRDAGGNASAPASIAVDVQPGTPAPGAPTVSDIRPPSDGTYNMMYHGYINIIVDFSASVTVTGSPTLGVRIGSTNTQFFEGFTSGRSVIFSFDPGSQQVQGTLTVTGPINLNGGTIKAADGTDASLSFTPVDAPGVLIDTAPPAPPVITSVSPANPTTDQAFTISGTAEPGVTVWFSSTGNASDPHTTADASGRWSESFGPLTAGSYRYTPYAEDEANNWSNWLRGAVAVTVTVTPAPTSTPPPPPPSSGGSATQTITFASPTGAVIIGQPISLGATSSAGLPITYSVVSGDATISGSVLTPQSTATLVVRASSAGDATYAAASTDVNFGNPQKEPQAITADTATQSVKSGSSVTLTATSSSGLPVTYSLVSGPATLSGNTLTLTGSSGTVLVRASQTGNDTFAAATDVTLQFAIVPIPMSRLVNFSARLHVSGHDAAGASIAGFVIAGSSPKQVLIRGVGPTLAQFGVSNPLTAPRLILYDSHGTAIATNTGWADDAQIAAAEKMVGAFDLAPGSNDAALLMTLQPGLYTAQIAADSGGNALVEIYDLTAATTSTTPLINISGRGTVGSGDDVLIGGFVISGDQPKRVLIRGIGPGLAQFLSGALTDPMLAVYDAKQTVIARNDNWGTPQPLTPDQQIGSAADIAAASAATGAFALPDGSADAALLLTLAPGAYSAVVTGANNAHGAAMVEIYEVPN